MTRNPRCATILGAVCTLVAGAALAATSAGAATGPSATDTGTTTGTAATLTVLVTNDDGVGAPGIDTLVRTLRKLDDTKVVVVAPATNQSGTDEKTTIGKVSMTRAHTAGGYPATAVRGYPADAVTAALDRLGVRPDVVISGINAGTNLGRDTKISGTIGAAKMAVQRGIPALALSQDTATRPQYRAGAAIARAWLLAHRAALLAPPVAAPTTLDSINIPNCPAGRPRGVTDVITAKDTDHAPGRINCTSGVTAPVTDVAAFENGYAALAVVPAGPRPGS